VSRLRPLASAAHSWARETGLYGYFLLALAQTWPLVLAPDRGLIGHARTDTLKHLWTLWWMRASVWSEGRFPFATQLVNFPEGMELYPIEPLNGIFVVLLPFVPLVAASNLLVLLNLTLTGLCGGALGRAVSGRALGGWIAGLLTQSSALMAHFVALGVGELQHLWLIPLGLVFTLRALRSGAARDWLSAGALMGVATIAAFYLGFFLGLSVGVLCASALLFGGGAGRLPTLRGAALALMSLGAVIVPVGVLFARSYGGETGASPGLWAAVFAEACQPVLDTVDTRLEPMALFHLQGWENDPPASAYLGGTYLGVGALALAAAGLIRRPTLGGPFVGIGVVGVVLAMGSYLSVDGAEVVAAAGLVRFPMLWLNRLLAHVAEPVNFPVRFLAMTVVALGALGSLAVAGPKGQPRSRPSLKDALIVAVVGLSALEPWALGQASWPMARAPLRELGVLQGIADAAATGGPRGVVDLSLALRPDARNRRTGLQVQLAHGLPTQAVPIERVEFFARGGQQRVEALSMVGVLRAAQQRGGTVDLAALDVEIALLREAGFGYLLLAEGWDTADAPIPGEAALSGWLGPPLVRGHGVAAWQLPEINAPEGIDAARAAQARRAAELEARVQLQGRGGSLAALGGRGATDACDGLRLPKRSELPARQAPFRGAPADTRWVKVRAEVALRTATSDPDQAEGELFLQVIRPDGGAGRLEGALRLDRPGAFELRVPAGHGRLLLRAARHLRADGAGDDRPLGEIEINVTEADLDGVVLGISPQ
jgi:hypothetical protein